MSGARFSPRTSLDAFVRSAEALRSICAALDLMAKRETSARVLEGNKIQKRSTSAFAAAERVRDGVTRDESRKRETGRFG